MVDTMRLIRDDVIVLVRHRCVSRSTVQDIARKRGIDMARPEVEALMDKLEHDGMVFRHNAVWQVTELGRREAWGIELDRKTNARRSER